jgi:hypothetical protein
MPPIEFSSEKNGFFIVVEMVYCSVMYGKSIPDVPNTASDYAKYNILFNKIRIYPFLSFNATITTKQQSRKIKWKILS